MSEQRVADLVVSLRQAFTDVAMGLRITDTGYGVDGMLFERAAEEIERLRTELETLKSVSRGAIQAARQEFVPDPRDVISEKRRKELVKDFEEWRAEQEQNLAAANRLKDGKPPIEVDIEDL